MEEIVTELQQKLVSPKLDSFEHRMFQRMTEGRINKNVVTLSIMV